MPSVLKKDGSRAEFDAAKLRASMMLALRKRPVSLEQVDSALQRIEQKLRSSGVREVSTAKLGELVMRELKKLDKVAYVRFASVYRSFDRSACAPTSPRSPDHARHEHADRDLASSTARPGGAHRQRHGRSAPAPPACGLAPVNSKEPTCTAVPVRRPAVCQPRLHPGRPDRVGIAGVLSSSPTPLEGQYARPRSDALVSLMTPSRRSGIGPTTATATGHGQADLALGPLRDRGAASARRLRRSPPPPAAGARPADAGCAGRASSTPPPHAAASTGRSTAVWNQ